MQVRALVAALVLSMLVNVAGIVFFVFFLKAQGQTRKLKRENTIMAQNIARVRLGAAGTEQLAAGQIISRPFVSLLDGKPDHFAFSAPSAPVTAESKPVLVVYLHGMGSNYMEPFCYPGTSAKIADVIQQFHADAGILSVNYRLTESWGTEAAFADITQNIREVLQMYPFKRIVLVGTSMGGCVSLNYACLAPPDIKEKLCGVVSVEGSADLAKVFVMSKNPGIQNAMMRAFGGAPDQIPQVYAARSLSGNIQQFPTRLRVSVISATKDKVIPPELQAEIVELLEKRGCKVNLAPVENGHGVPPASMYCQGVDFVLKP